MVKGERKGHRWAGSSSDPTFYVDPDVPYTTLGAMHKATGTSRHLVMSITKINDWSSFMGEARIAGETEQPINDAAGLDI